MDLPTKETYDNIIKKTLNDYELIIQQVEIINKGRHVHEINRNICFLKNCIQTLKQEDVSEATIRKLAEAKEYEHALLRYLYLISQGR